MADETNIERIGIEFDPGASVSVLQQMLEALNSINASVQGMGTAATESFARLEASLNSINSTLQRTNQLLAQTGSVGAVGAEQAAGQMQNLAAATDSVAVAQQRLAATPAPVPNPAGPIPTLFYGPSSALGYYNPSAGEEYTINGIPASQYDAVMAQRRAAQAIPLPIEPPPTPPNAGAISGIEQWQLQNQNWANLQEGVPLEGGVGGGGVFPGIPPDVLESYTKADTATQGLTQSTKSMYYETRGLFAAVLGLNLVMNEFAQATGDKVNPQMKQLITSMESVSRFAMAGVSIGMMLGPEGAVAGAGIGALVGGVAALAAGLVQVSPEAQALNTELDKLAAKDNTAQTLASIMGWTQQDAQAALTAAKNNYELADSLDQVAKQREAPSIIDQLLAVAPRGMAQLTGQTLPGLQGLGQNEQTNLLAQEMQTAMFTLATLRVGPNAPSLQSQFDALNARLQEIRNAYTVQPNILQGQLAGAQFMSPYASLLSQTGADAAAKSTSLALSELTGWQDKYSKNVLTMASQDADFGKVLNDNTVKMIAYAGSIDAAKKAGQDYSAAQSALKTLTIETTNAFQAAQMNAIMNGAAATPAAPHFAGGIQMTSLTQAELNREMAIANQLADQEVAALQAANIPTDKLTEGWNNTVTVMRLANGQIETLTGKTAALIPEAQKLMQSYTAPSVQSAPELNARTAPMLQQYLRQYETELSSLGVQQQPREYLMFGAGGSLYKFVTSSDAMTLAMDLLREQIKQNTDTLRGSYNLPTSFGYRPPTPWQYYASGATDMGPVNYPWLVGGLGNQKNPTMGLPASGAADYLATTLSMPTAQFGMSVDKFGVSVDKLIADAMGRGGNGLGYASGSIGTLAGAASSTSSGLVALADQFSRRYGMNDLNVLRAIIQAESNWNPNAIGDRGASIGLLQNNMRGGRGTGYTQQQLLDPSFNLQLGMPEISHWYQLGVQQGLSGAQLAMFVGEHAQRPAAGMEQNYGRAYNQIVSGQTPLPVQGTLQVQGIPQTNSSLSSIQGHVSATAGHTAAMQSLGVAQVAQQTTMVGLLGRMLSALVARQVINVQITGIAGAGGSGLTGSLVAGTAGSSIGSSMGGANRSVSVRTQ